MAAHSSSRLLHSMRTPLPSSYAQLVRHTSRGGELAASDRYTAIRQFFSRPYATAGPQTARLIPSTRLRRDLAYNNLNTQRFPVTHHILPRTRLLHTSSIRQKHDRHDQNTSSTQSPDKPHAAEQTSKAPSPPERPPDPPPYLENYSAFFRRLASSHPHLHRPTRDDLLAVATGFWERLRVNFKWFTIRSFRKFNADDISAFVSLLVLSQTVWILVGTTTFVSVIFATANSLRLQENIARSLSDYLTDETGVTVVFESAIVPKWKDSRISFKNVYISRRPKSFRNSVQSRKSAHLHAVGYDVSNHPSYHHVEEEPQEEPPAEEEDTNYTMFDLQVDSIDVTLSLWRWLDGKGIVQDAVIKGVRGVLDRRSVFWDPDVPLDPASFRRSSQPGDFDLESLALEDILLTVHQPDDFRPFTFSIFRAELGPVRRQWLFYDFLSAEGMVGQFDGCLFSLHRPQSMGRTNEKEMREAGWGRVSRFRIDGVNIDHLQAMTTAEGPIQWITSGKIDAVLDFKFPRAAPGDDALEQILGGIADAVAELVEDHIPGQRQLAKPPLMAPEDEAGAAEGEGNRVVVDIDLRFKDLRAAVPVWTNDLSYVSSAAIRPIVAFMNAHHTLVPIRCRAIKDLSDFDGSWTLWETGLSDEIALKTYEAMAYHVLQANFNRRITAVSWWSLQKTVAALLATLRTLADPVRAHLKEVYADMGGLVPL